MQSASAPFPHTGHTEDGYSILSGTGLTYPRCLYFSFLAPFRTFKLGPQVPFQSPFPPVGPCASPKPGPHKMPPGPGHPGSTFTRCSTCVSSPAFPLPASAPSLAPDGSWALPESPWLGPSLWTTSVSLKE